MSLSMPEQSSYTLTLAPFNMAVRSGMYVESTARKIIIQPVELVLIRIAHVLGTVVACWTLSRFLIGIILWWVPGVVGPEP